MKDLSGMQKKVTLHTHKFRNHREQAFCDPGNQIKSDSSLKKQYTLPL